MALGSILKQQLIMGIVMTPVDCGLFCLWIALEWLILLRFMFLVPTIVQNTGSPVAGETTDAGIEPLHLLQPSFHQSIGNHHHAAGWFLNAAMRFSCAAGAVGWLANILQHQHSTQLTCHACMPTTNSTSDSD
jgi:hypothetical protein